jgi:hypothetical protein
MHNRLIRGQYNISSGPLLLYNFTNATNALSAAQTFNTGTFIWGLTVSPDGIHAAYMEGGTGVSDVDTTNLSNTYGSWSGGIYTQAGGFSPNSQYFIDAGGASSPATITVYSVATHALYQSYGIGSVGYGVNRVGFSNGGQIVYGLDKDFNGNSSVIHWHLFP